MYERRLCLINRGSSGAEGPSPAWVIGRTPHSGDPSHDLGVGDGRVVGEGPLESETEGVGGGGPALGAICHRRRAPPVRIINAAGKAGKIGRRKIKATTRPTMDCR